jgi:hypothetical protein
MFAFPERAMSQPKSSQQPILVLEAGVEGGGLDIVAIPQGAGYIFRDGGTTIDLDENDDEIWRDIGGREAERIADLLPKELGYFYAIYLHPMVADDVAAFLEAHPTGNPEMHSVDRWQEAIAHCRKQATPFGESNGNRWNAAGGQEAE